FVGGAGGFVPSPRRPVFLERNVFINNGGGGPSSLASFGIGAALGTGAGLLLGSAFSPPPPPPVLVTQPVVVAQPGQPIYVAPPPPTVVYTPPAPYQAAPPTVVIDPVAQAMARLQSHH